MKCDAVFSLARVWVNGAKLGEVEGGFTPFEFDVTGAVQPGKTATVAVEVEADTTAATLSAMTKYAQHQLGGITRKVYLFAVPEVNTFRFHAETRFDAQYRDAVLRLTCGVANQGKSNQPAELRFRLTAPDGKPVTLARSSIRLGTLRPGVTREQVVDIPVAAPLHWENEHPRLYRVTADLVVAGSVAETVERHIGFRQIEIRGNQLLLNGHAIKLHGTERHETNPVLGRSLNAAIWAKEVHLLHEANINYVFTSHYPVPEEFLDLCDAVGLLVTEELPSVWVNPPYNKEPAYYATISQIAAAVLEHDRSHPSIQPRVIKGT